MSMKNLKVKLMLSINENGCCNVFTPWKVKSVFSLNGQNKSPQNSYYHFYPELVLNGSENNIPATVICANCAESISIIKYQNILLQAKLILVLAIKLALKIHQYENGT